ncbi:interferon gamma [Psammomys obesus]|uniref:interferon gamma n=1 Tax=Psammomys obesus TaxID=48139 RepID=UPI00245321AE|nr:interferon gamma [Psammomys obesus]
MNATHCILALQLCLLAISGCSSQVPIIEEIENLKRYFNSSNSDVGDSKDVVLHVLRNWQEDGDTKVIDVQIASFYFKLFEALKGNQAIEKSINVIRAELIANFFNNSEAKYDGFMSITKIEVNDPQIQSKAINELVKVMSHLSPRVTLRKRKRSRCCFGGGNRLNKKNPASTI